jgi:hypothetical protein
LLKSSRAMAGRSWGLRHFEPHGEPPSFATLNQIYAASGIPQRVTLSETWYYSTGTRRGRIDILARRAVRVRRQHHRRSDHHRCSQSAASRSIASNDPMTKRFASTSSTGIGSEAGWTLDHCTGAVREQAQERLVLRVQRPTTQKCAYVEVRYPTARGQVRLVPDEHAISVRFPAQKPPISIGAAIKFSRLDADHNDRLVHLLIRCALNCCATRTSRST